MKKILLVLVIFVLATGLTGCGIEPEVVDESLTPVSSEESFEVMNPPSRPTVSFPDKSSAAVSEKNLAAMNKEQAVAIAKEYVLKKYNKSFEESEVEAYDAHELHYAAPEGVSFVIYMLADKNSNLPSGGGGFEVRIERGSGKILFCMQQSFLGQPVKTKEQAIAIAKEYVSQRIGERFDEFGYEFDGKKYRYEIKVCDSSDYNWVPEGQWLVWYELEGRYEGGPAVYIQKSNGRVLALSR